MIRCHHHLSVEYIFLRWLPVSFLFSSFLFCPLEVITLCITMCSEIKFGGQIVYSRTVEEVERAAQELLDFTEAKKRNEGQCIIGLDIEWRPTFRKGNTLTKNYVYETDLKYYNYFLFIVM